MHTNSHIVNPLIPEPIFSLPSAQKVPIRHDASSRKRHIRLLNDVLHLSLERGQWDKAKRAWSILARCPEVAWKEMWSIGLLLITKSGLDADARKEGEFDASSSSGPKDRIDYLKTLMLRFPARVSDGKLRYCAWVLTDSLPVRQSARLCSGSSHWNSSNKGSTRTHSMNWNCMTRRHPWFCVI